MTAWQRQVLWQIYLLVICLLSLTTMGIAGSAALIGSLRFHYPKLMLSTAQWEQAESFEHYRVQHRSAQSTGEDRGRLRTEWEDYRRRVIGSERQSGVRLLLQGAAVMVAAFAVFLPHWWLTRRLIRPAT
ncbi:MAG: hypothetical protein HY699_07535 [Deltaproteobacteria bacterium]|nr:hypothetical protein [Deltaproteobacteria bacterium]